MHRISSESDIENDGTDTNNNYILQNKDKHFLPHQLYSITFKNNEMTKKYIFNQPKKSKKSRSLRKTCLQYTKNFIKLFSSNCLNILLFLTFIYLVSFRLQIFIYNSLFMTKPNNKNLENFFFSRIDNNMKINHNFEPIFQKNLNFSSLNLQDSLNKTDSSSQTFNSYAAEMSKIQNSFINLFLENNIIYQACPSVPDTLKGFLNSSQMLQQANLTDLVEFYDTVNKTKQQSNAKGKNVAQEKYINKKIDKEKTPEFWQLWNSNDITLLNVSRDYYGHDGMRIELGGHWKPKECISNYKIAIIIPYRDRLPHLKVLLYYLHMILQRQLHDYRIFVVEPTTPLNVRFNKGRVMNAAFLEALKTDDKIDCFIFHDVDLIPEDDRTLYSCPPYPRHLSVEIDKFDYILPYDDLVGGVFAISREHYRLTNGYSNMFWGWGGEDDDLSVRIKANKLRIQRPPKKFSRYKMIRHRHQELNPNAEKTLRTSKVRYSTDGVNTVKYKVVNINLFTIFTHIIVDIGEFNEK